MADFRVLNNKRPRKAEPPAVKQNVVYDVVLPPKVPGFTFTVQGDTIILTEYVGKDKHVIIPGTVTTPDGGMVFRILIGKEAFFDCRSLDRVTIREGITSIGDRTFKDCIYLTHITIPKSRCTKHEFTGRIRNSLRQFECSLKHPRGFETRNLGDSVEIVKFHPTDFPEVIIPKTFFDPPLRVTSIGKHAFGKGKLRTSRIIVGEIPGADSRDSGKYGHLTRITIPEDVTSIGEGAFADCTSLADIMIPEGVTSISDDAFRGCTSLTSMILPKGVTTIGKEAFRDCRSLTNITIPESVTSIDEGAFADCRSLAGIMIPEGVTSISDEAFRGCTSLASTILPKGVTIIGKEAFRDCRSLVNITTSEGVTSIAKGALVGCVSLTNTTIPERITSIKMGAFYGCESLINITIPERITSINREVFYGCKSLTNIIIPDGVINISAYVFHRCTALANVTIPKSVTNIGPEAFKGCGHVTIYTPRGSVAWRYAEENKINHKEIIP